MEDKKQYIKRYFFTKEEVDKNDGDTLFMITAVQEEYEKAIKYRKKTEDIRIEMIGWNEDKTLYQVDSIANFVDERTPLEKAEDETKDYKDGK